MTPTVTPTAALLPSAPVLLVQAPLASAVGLVPALFLQQVHYWLQRSRHTHEGRTWIYNTYPQWQAQLCFLSEDQIARAVGGLRRLGVLLMAQLAPDRRDRRNWYSIDYPRLQALPAAPSTAPLPAPARPPAPADPPPVLAALLPLSAGAAPAAAPPAPGPLDRRMAPRPRALHDSEMRPRTESSRPETSPQDFPEADRPPAPDPPPPSGGDRFVQRAAWPAPRPAGVPRPDRPAPLPDLAAITWVGYRQAVDPQAPPALQARIRADLALAAAAGWGLTPAGLDYALAEAVTARGPCWPYRLAIWRAHPEGASAPAGPRDPPPVARFAARRPPGPAPLDPAKYLAPGGKYAHLFAACGGVA